MSYLVDIGEPKQERERDEKNILHHRWQAEDETKKLYMCDLNAYFNSKIY
jgi:hypothetical protein